MGNETWEKQEGGVFWKPEQKGEELIGEVVEKGDDDYGSFWKIKKADGVVSKTPSHKALMNRMADVKIGDEVKIVYLGEDTAPKQKGWSKTRLYDVFIKKA